MIEQPDLQSPCFVAVDFETLYPQHESACAVGMVKYRNGVILGQFYSLICPPEIVWTGHCNSDIHGIEPTMLKNAPSFADLFWQINAFVGNAIPVAHNACVERACLEKCCRYYKLAEPDWIDRFEDTYQMTGMKLVSACKEAGIETNRHHDPLQDAMMCAQLHMTLIGTKRVVPIPSENSRIHRTWSHETKCNHEDLIPLPESEVECKDNPFFRAHVVYTGEFFAFPDRREIGSLLKRLGAKVESNKTQKTECLLCGFNPGPKKVEIARERGIVLIEESDFMMVVEKLGLIKP